MLRICKIFFNFIFRIRFNNNNDNDIYLNFGIFLRIRAAVFKTFCNRNKVESGTQSSSELQYSYEQ